FFVILSQVYGGNYYLIGVNFLIALYSKSATIDKLIGDDTKLLEELLEFIQDIKHNFHEHEMADEAINESLDNSTMLINLHGRKVYEAIKEEESLEKYYENCPNRYLKLIAGYCFLTKEFGDKRIEGKSLFVKNMNNIVEEIKTELVKRDKIKYWLRALTTISVVPILFPSIIEKWMKANFPQANFFYESSIGFIAKIVMLIICLTCFVTLKQLQKNTEEQFKLVVKDKYWEENLLKVKFFNKLVKTSEPKNTSKEHFKMIKLLQNSGSYMNMDFLYTRRILIGIISCILTICLFSTYHKINKTSILNNTHYKFSSSTMLNNLGNEVDIAKIDKDILSNTLKENSFNSKKVANLLKEKGGIKEEDIQKNVKRIEKKFNTIKSEKFKWYEFIIAIMIGFMATDIPTLILKFQVFLRKVEMENEVFQFHTIILLLMYHEQSSIQMILEWMERFSNVYFNPLRKCLNNLGKGEVEALQNLKEETKYKPFKRLVDNLIKSEKIEISEAFESLETEREFYKDDRKEANKRSAHERISAGEFLGFIPLYSLVIIFLLIPLLWTSLNELNSILNNFKI
ncbi:hypothetical protein, partial [Clostridium botulinum]